MKKRMFSILLLPMLILFSCSGCAGELAGRRTQTPGWDETPDFTFPSEARLPELSQSEPLPEPQGSTRPLSGVWVSYLDLDVFGEDPTLAQEKLGRMMDNIAGMGLSAVFFQVRPFADALFESEFYPCSYLFTGKHGDAFPGYDLLAMAVAAAHARNLTFHAWINPYRVQAFTAAGPVPSGAQDTPQYARWIEEGMLVSLPSGIYFDPASEKARSVIFSGAAEIAEKYGVDSIVIDDYFYPSDYGESDAAAYAAYTGEGGSLSRDDWRREQVDLLVRGLYDSIHAANENCRFGISPAADTDKNYALRYANVVKWAGEPGWTDYLVPQLYFGFENAAKPFSATAQQWASLCVCGEVTLYAGLAAYKTGESDRYAGSGGSEWQQHDDILAREMQTLSDIPRYSGAVFYSYASLFGDGASLIREQERVHLREYLSPVDPA